jgi:hypothetical protein
MTDDLHLRLAALYPGVTLVSVATATLPAAGVPAGGFREAVALTLLAAASSFTALELSPRTEAPQARETPAEHWSAGFLPGGLGIALHGETPDTQDVLRLELPSAGVLPLWGDVLVLDDAAPTRVLLRPKKDLPASARIFGNGRELVVTLHPDRRVEFTEVPEPAAHVVAPTLVDTDGAALSALAEHPPPIAQWTEGAAVQPWLRDACTELIASPWALDHLAAAGLLGRLWTPTDPEIRRRTILGTFTPPGHRARDWIVALPEAGLDAAERAALREADRIDASLDAPGDDAAQTLSLALRRDDIESVRSALAFARRGGSLDRRLRALDVRGRACWSAHPVDTRLRDDERLRCVRWSEPGAWWGLFAEA